MSAAGSSLALRRRWADLIASGYDRLVASDPGLARLRLALGVLVSVALAVLVLGLAGFAITGVLLGASIAMVTSSGPVQRTVRRQAAVIGLTIVPAAGALTLSALLGGHRVVSDLVFLAVIFVAVYIRRIPDYGFPLGFPAFMMFFFASFVGASPAALPMLLLAIAIGLVCAGLIRIVVLPPRSARTFRRVRRGFQARLAQVLDSVADLLADGATPSRLDRLRRRVDRMHESALMVEAELDTPLAPDDAALHQRRVLGAELAAESLAHEARRAMTAADRPGDADRAVARDRLATLIELIRIDRQRGGSGSSGYRTGSATASSEPPAPVPRRAVCCGRSPRSARRSPARRITGRSSARRWTTTRTCRSAPTAARPPRRYAAWSVGCCRPPGRRCRPRWAADSPSSPVSCCPRSGGTGRSSPRSWCSPAPPRPARR
ncbi:hypothetical protein Athai_11600 [Actinocatenispora thailandica]|uniref:FUSC family protein n=1 Tax=Actinocatenispora thailandica TaxID=227318 RepID=A0A7R7DL76_9ACTN|nr:hypothetical protein [Actinocatenispora thailandica]BCJ33657.1 hypothetical protein Athai_11600 [Actinocatenispora thailandica]